MQMLTSKCSQVRGYLTNKEPGTGGVRTHDSEQYQPQRTKKLLTESLITDNW